MRIILRIVAIGIAVVIIGTVGLAWRIWHFDRFTSLMATRSFGVLTVVGWGLTVTVGAFAATQLWRLRESGRRSALLLVGFSLFYRGAGWWIVRRSAAASRPAWFAIAANAALALLLLSPAARRVCRPGTLVAADASSGSPDN